MRQILVDHARRHQAVKRGGGMQNVSLKESLSFSEERSADLLALDEALNELAAFDPRKCKIIELRFFGGLTVEETAQLLHLSTSTVGRQLRLAEVWLRREMENKCHDS